MCPPPPVIVAAVFGMCPGFGAPALPFWAFGELVDLEDPFGDWYEAIVTEVSVPEPARFLAPAGPRELSSTHSVCLQIVDGKLGLHYTYWGERLDELLPPGSPRIAPHGTHVCTWRCCSISPRFTPFCSGICCSAAFLQI